MKIGICKCCQSILMTEKMIELFDILLNRGTLTITDIAIYLYKAKEVTKTSLVKVSRLVTKLEDLGMIEKYKIASTVYVKGRLSEIYRNVEVKEI